MKRRNLLKGAIALPLLHMLPEAKAKRVHPKDMVFDEELNIWLENEWETIEVKASELRKYDTKVKRDGEQLIVYDQSIDRTAYIYYNYSFQIRGETMRIPLYYINESMGCATVDTSKKELTKHAARKQLNVIRKIHFSCIELDIDATILMHIEDGQIVQTVWT